MGLGAVFVNQLLKWEAQVEQDLDKMLEKAKAANERRYIGFIYCPFPSSFLESLILGFGFIYWNRIQHKVLLLLNLWELVVLL